MATGKTGTARKRATAGRKGGKTTAAKRSHTAQAIAGPTLGTRQLNQVTKFGDQLKAMQTVWQENIAPLLTSLGGTGGKGRQIKGVGRQTKSQQGQQPMAQTGT
jgi:hypothetical protein